MSTSSSWLRAGRVLLALALCCVTSGCGLVAAAAIAAIEDGIDNGNDGDGDGGSGDPRPKVAVVHALPNGTHVADVIDKLVATGAFASVTGFDAAVSTPTFVELSNYDVALVVADGAFADPVALGNVLATFADSGRGVVSATSARPGVALGGAWATGAYDAIAPPDVLSGDGLIAWVADVPDQPIIVGLVLPGGGTGSDRPDVSTVTAGSTLVASWATGEPLVAVRVTTGGTRMASLGFHVVTDAVDPSFVDDGSDAKTIVARALRWVALEI